MQSETTFRVERAGIAIEVIEYGARLVRCVVPDGRGVLADVVPGFDRAADYVERGGTMGAILGRYGNRIGGGRIRIHGKDYELSKNFGDDTMHGGTGHFGTRWWRGAYEGPYAIALDLESPDGDQGWPGTMSARVTYSLTEKAELRIDMQAVCDHDTYLNMLFHGYWNLAGHASGSVLGHTLKLAAHRFTPRGENGLTTGERRAVDGSPLDFRTPKSLGLDIAATGRGYVDNLCLDGHQGGTLRPVVWLLDPESGRAFILETDQLGLQLFTANSWSNLNGKDGVIYQAHSAVALETQHYPNTPNTPAFSPRLVPAGETYHHRMVVRFCTVGPQDREQFFSGSR